MSKIFVFDLGNVIVRPMDKKKLYTLLNCNISYDEFVNLFEKDESSIKLHQGLISTEENIKKILTLSGSPKNVEEYKKIFLDEIRNGLFSDTIEIINLLKKDNKKVCLLSNLREIDFEWFKTQYDIANFDKLYLSYEMKMLKPNKEIYLAMIKDLNVSPNEIYFFDDNKDNILSAQELGINAYLVTGNNIKEIFINANLI